MEKLTRRRAIEIFIEERKGDELLILNVGATSRMICALDHKETNLYQVAVGYVSPVALGVALALPSEKVISIEGDGSVTMGLEKLLTIANQSPKNLGVIIFANGTWEAGGSFYTANHGKANLETIAKGAGIENCVTVRTDDEFRRAFRSGLRGNELFCIVAEIPGKSPEEFLLAETQASSSGEEAFPPTPFTITENSYRFTRALVDRGLIPTWHEVCFGSAINQR